MSHWRWTDDEPRDVVTAGTPRFEPGRLISTPGVLDLVKRGVINPAVLLGRHLSGDWGEVDDHDRRVNDTALATGERLMSVYGPDGDTRVYMITEADRSLTAILLPSEYWHAGAARGRGQPTMSARLTIGELPAYAVTPEPFWALSQLAGDDGDDRRPVAHARGWHAVPSWGREGWDLGPCPGCTPAGSSATTGTTSTTGNRCPGTSSPNCCSTRWRGWGCSPWRPRTRTVWRGWH